MVILMVHCSLYSPEALQSTVYINNKVYVTEEDNHRVHVLNSDLTFSGTFGEKGNGNGQLTGQVTLPVTDLGMCT